MNNFKPVNEFGDGHETFQQVNAFHLRIDTPLYILYESEKSFELLKRLFKSDEGGAELTIFWGYDVSSAVKTEIPFFSQLGHNNITSNLKAYVLNDFTESEGLITPTGVASIVSEGVVREFDFISNLGGKESSGGVSTDVEPRRYNAGGGFLLRVNSKINDNLVMVGYTTSE